MTGGLLITAVVATFVASSDDLAARLFSNGFVFWAIIIAQFGLVLALSAAIHKMSPTMALGLFFIYSGLMGLTMSIVFLAYDLGTVAIAFGVTTATFAALSIVGLTTKKDLTKWGPLLMVPLFGLIIASMANMFLQSPVFDYLISYLGVLLFMGLTLYNSKAIKTMTFEALSNGDVQGAVARKFVAHGEGNL